MKIKKFLVLTLTLAFSSSLLLSQSLVEIAKKEKERRARLKGKTVKVITNADLRRMKGKASVSVMRIQPPEKEKSTPPKEEKVKSQTSPAEKDFSSEWMNEELFRKKKNSLFQNLEKAKEYVSLLETKLNGLWQEFNTMDDVISRDAILREMEETRQKIKKAKEEEEKARKELDKFLKEARKKGVPPGWLR
ncbi:MAG: hypothetical protein ACE5LC_00935, partial [Candidatus Aminicenantales bacterium]